MKTVGSLVQQSIDFTDRGLLEAAFISACGAFSETAKRAFEKESLSETDYKKFIEENRRLISAMGVPSVLQEIKSPFELQKNTPQIRTSYPLKDFLFYAVYQATVSSRLPAAFTFSNLASESNVGKVLLPVNLIWGLLASVIFHPANKDETLPDKYWFGVGDFKMFISELWGRRDLIERIMKFYQDREGD